MGYVTVLAEGLMGMQQRLNHIKVVTICMVATGKSKKKPAAVNNNGLTFKSLDKQ